MKLLIYDSSRAISLYINKSLRVKYSTEILVFLEDLLSKTDFDIGIAVVVISDKSDLYALIQLLNLSPEIILITGDQVLKDSLKHLEKVTIININHPKKEILEQIETIINKINNVVQFRAILR
jgi:hypothetical protein